MTQYYTIVPPNEDYPIVFCENTLFDDDVGRKDYALSYINYHVGKIITQSAISDDFCVIVNTDNVPIIVEVAKTFIEHMKPCVFSYYNREDGSFSEQVIFQFKHISNGEVSYEYIHRS